MRPFVQWCRFAFVKVNRWEGSARPGAQSGVEGRNTGALVRFLRRWDHFSFFLSFFPATLLGASQETLFLCLTFMLLRLVRTIFPLQQILNNSSFHPLLAPTSFQYSPSFFPSFPDLGVKAERQSRDRLHDSISPRLLAPGDPHLVQSCYLIHTMIDRL